MKTLTAIFAMIVFITMAAHADVRKITFVNNTGEDADDLHIEFTRNGVIWDRNAPHDFDNTRNNPPGSPKYNFWGTTIEAGDSTTLTFTCDGEIKIKEWWWTKGGNNEKDGDKVGKSKKDNGGAVLIFNGGPATGNGLIRVSLGDDNAMFQTMPGMMPQQTVNMLATMLNQHFNSGPEIRMYERFNSPTSVMMAGNTLGDSSQMLTVQILNNDASQPAQIIPFTPSVLNITALIEGRYNGNSNRMDGDYVEVSLRSNAPPFNVLHQSTCFLDSIGNGEVLAYNIPNGMPFYIQINHRNTIETWSSMGNISFSNGLSAYNFTQSIGSAYGANQKQVGARFCFFSGDVTQDGVIDGTDVGMIDNDAYNFAFGYLTTDLTGDEAVDATDYAIADNNASAFVSVVRP